MKGSYPNSVLLLTIFWRELTKFTFSAISSGKFLLNTISTSRHTVSSLFIFKIAAISSILFYRAFFILEAILEALFSKLISLYLIAIPVYAIKFSSLKSGEALIL